MSHQVSVMNSRHGHHRSTILRLGIKLILLPLVSIGGLAIIMFSIDHVGHDYVDQNNVDQDHEGYVCIGLLGITLLTMLFLGYSFLYSELVCLLFHWRR